MIRRIIYLLLVLCVGFLSGVLGAIILTQESAVSTGANAVFRQNFDQSYPFAHASDFVSKIAPSTVRIVETHSSEIISHVFGIIVSSDGWIAVPGKLKSNDLKVIDKDNYQYEIKKNIYHPGLDVSLIKSTKTNSKPVELLDRSKLTDTMEGFIVMGFSSVTPLIITPTGYPFNRITGNPLYVHELAKRFNYDQEFKQINNSVFTLDGTLIGFTSNYGIIPLSALHDLLPQIFKNSKLSLPTLPLFYRDLAWTFKTEKKSATSLVDHGALITGATHAQYRLQAPDGKSVRVGKDDIIVAVNDERIDRNRGLADIIQQYRVGDMITLTIIGKDRTDEKQIKVILEPIK